jgi:hypothetical protein
MTREPLRLHSKIRIRNPKPLERPRPHCRNCGTLKAQIVAPTDGCGECNPDYQETLEQDYLESWCDYVEAFETC